MVCQACQKVLLGQTVSTYGSFDHHETVEGLRRAAEIEECQICHSLWFAIDPEARRILVEHDQQSSERKGTYVHFEEGLFKFFASEPKLEYTLWLHPDLSALVSDDEQHIKYFLCPRTGQCPSAAEFDQPLINPLEEVESTNSSMSVKRVTSSTTGSPDATATAIQWLGECVTNHKTCNHESERKNWNPTRLLDVHSNTNGDINLVEGQDFASALIYSTLSHKWGQLRPYKLNESTAPQLKAGIALPILPKTFRDAIQVTRALGIRYLWIDSLCIKQDDAGDWTREASLMHKVYRHGHINVSATAATDSSRGLFVERDHLASAFTDVNATHECAVPLTRYVACDRNLWARNVSANPLSERGWVVQERILSPRILHFGSQQLCWECRELHASESFPKGLPKEVYCDTAVRSLDLEIFATKQQQYTPTEERRKFRAYEMWMRIVRMYCRCSLTRPEDKVPAIMGVAKQMSQLTNDTYIAGMWRRYLESQLLWQMEGDNNARSRPRQYRAPTWSWMSLDGKVSWVHVCDTGVMAKVKEVELELSTEDEMGPLSGGRLYLEGRLRQVRIERRSPGDDDDNDGIYTITLMPNIDATPEGSTVVPYLDLDFDTLEADNESGVLFCMEILLTTEHEEGGEYHQLQFLLLRCKGGEAGIYTRIGLLNLSWYAGIYTPVGSSSLLFDKMTAALATQPRLEDAPCVYRDEAAGLHTVCIV